MSDGPRLTWEDVDNLRGLAKQFGTGIEDFSPFLRHTADGGIELDLSDAIGWAHSLADRIAALLLQDELPTLVGDCLADDTALRSLSGLVAPPEVARELDAAANEADRQIEEQRLERLLSMLKCVYAARVSVSPQGRIEEVHLLAGAKLSPKQAVRAAETALGVAGFSVDRRLISVAQVKVVDDGDRGCFTQADVDLLDRLRDRIAALVRDEPESEEVRCE